MKFIAAIWKFGKLARAAKRYHSTLIQFLSWGPKITFRWTDLKYFSFALPLIFIFFRKWVTLTLSSILQFFIVIFSLDWREKGWKPGILVGGWQRAGNKMVFPATQWKQQKVSYQMSSLHPYVASSHLAPPYLRYLNLPVVFTKVPSSIDRCHPRESMLCRGKRVGYCS